MSLATCSEPYKAALEIQRLLMADMRNPETPAAVKAQLARAHIEQEKLKRVMRGLPANTSQAIKAEPKSKRRVIAAPEPEPEES